MPKPPGYYSFLLRMWQTRDGERCTWCASLEQPGTRERWAFATLDEMFDFLRSQAALHSGPAGAPAPKRPPPGSKEKPLYTELRKEKTEP
jgi:hypothetical protein